MLTLTTPSESPARNRVREWFFAQPDVSVTLSELIEHTRIAKTTAHTIAHEFIKEGFLTKKTVGRAWQLSVRKDHEWNYTRKIAVNLNHIFESGLLTHIKNEYPQAKAIVLFGSYSTGQDTQASDIDIAVEIAKQQPVTTKQFATYTHLGHRKSVPVNVFVFNRKRVDRNVFASIANGIVLHGFLEAHP